MPAVNQWGNAPCRDASRACSVEAEKDVVQGTVELVVYWPKRLLGIIRVGVSWEPFGPDGHWTRGADRDPAQRLGTSLDVVDPDRETVGIFFALDRVPQVVGNVHALCRGGDPGTTFAHEASRTGRPRLAVYLQLPLSTGGIDQALLHDVHPATVERKFAFSVDLDICAERERLGARVEVVRISLLGLDQGLGTSRSLGTGLALVGELRRL